MASEEQPRRRLLRVAQAAHYCGMARGAFDRMRPKGQGPRWIRLGTKLIVYDQADLDAWLEANKSPPPKAR